MQYSAMVMMLVYICGKTSVYFNKEKEVVSAHYNYDLQVIQERSR